MQGWRRKAGDSEEGQGSEGAQATWMNE